MGTKKGFLQRHTLFFTTFHRFADLVILFLSGVLAFWLRRHSWQLPQIYLSIILLGGVLLLLLFPNFRLYDTWRGMKLRDELYALNLGSLGIFSLLTVVVFFTKTGNLLSRIWYLSWILLSWNMLMLFRILLRMSLRWLREKGYSHRRLIIVGFTSKSRELIRQIRSAPWIGLEIIGYVTTDSQVPCSSFEGIPVLGNFGNLEELLQESPVDQCWFTLPVTEIDKVQQMVRKLHNTVEMTLILDQVALELFSCPIRTIAGIPGIRLNFSPRSSWNTMTKQALDFGLAGLILCLISPLMLLISIGVKLSSPGPIIF